MFAIFRRTKPACMTTRRKPASRKPRLEVLEDRTLLTTVQAAMQTFYMSDSTEKFIPVSGGPAVFEGNTTNYFNTNTNESSANWDSGSFALGDFGSAQFHSQAVDAQHRDYFVSVIPVVAGVGLSGLTATVYGRDGFNKEVTLPQLQLPDPNEAIIPTKIYAPTPNDEGYSTLEPSVLQQLMSHDEASALRDLEARLDELKDFHQELVKNAAEIASLTLTVALLAHGLEASADLSPWDFVKDDIELSDTGNTIADLFKSFGLWIVDKTSPFVQNVEQAYQRVETLHSTEKTLAAKTFLPTRVVVTGTSDDSGFGIKTIGGPFQSYLNDFQFVGSGHTVGTSVFFGSNGNVISGPINTQNYYDPNGEVVDADSTIALPQANLFRYAARTGPLTTVDDPNGDGDPSDSYDYFPTEFQFSPRLNSNGAFAEQLTGFSTTGNVKPTTAPDGSQAALIEEDPSSSLATTITVPDADVPLLVMSLGWLGELNPSEAATFTVDFIDANSVTTQLYQTNAADPLLHGEQLQSLVVPVPLSLRGQTGVIRFKLDPSSSDGVDSRVMLGGFGIFGASGDFAPPDTTASLAGPAGTNGWFTGPVTATLAATDPEPGSGLASTFYSLDGGEMQTYNGPFTIADDGTHSLIFYSIDNAGNTEVDKTLSVNIDQSKPTLTVTATPQTLWPPNGQLVPVTISGTIADATSGLNPSSLHFAVTDEYGLVQPTGSIQVDANGNYSFTILLQSSRKGEDKDGRRYTIFISASDEAGNSQSTSTDVIVAHDLSKDVSVKRSNVFYSHSDQLYHTTLTITNTSKNTINGNLEIDLQGLTAGVALHDATVTINGTTYSLEVTTNDAGDPIIRVPRNVLASLPPGKSVALALRFSDPKLIRFGYTTEVFSDS